MHSFTVVCYENLCGVTSIDPLLFFLKHFCFLHLNPQKGGRLFFCVCSIFPVLSLFFFFFCNLFATLTQCRHQCTCLWVGQSFCVLFRAGDIFSSVKVLYFFNNSWIGGIKLMFHAWGVKDEREERSKLERNKKKSNWKTGRKWQGKN